MPSYEGWRPYTEEDVRNNAPNTAGVYIIRVTLTTGGSRVIYVGQAGDLKKRLLAHLSENEENSCLKTHQVYSMEYCWIELPLQPDRDWEESEKIKKYQPECNTQGK